MLSRRDLIHSRQYLRLRQVRALVSHRPDPLDWAGRHSGTAAFAGVMILVVALAATAVIGLVFPGNATGWQRCDAVIVEKDTGATYVCDAASRTLYPVVNFGSAALIMGASRSTRVAGASLTWPRGALLGLPGAPDELVPSGNYLTGRWSLCSVLRPDPAGARRPATVILAGAEPAAAEPLGARALLLAGPDGTRYLLWSGHRFPITDAAYVLPALGFSGTEGVPVGDAFLAPIPLGAKLAPIDVPDAGAALDGFPAAKVGQLVRLPAADGPGRVYLVRRDGLQEVSALQQALVRTAAAAQPVPVSPADLAGARVVPALDSAGFAPPAELPAFARPDDAGRVCALMVADRIDVVVDAELPRRVDTVVAASTPSAEGTPLADAVLVEPGHAVLVRAMSAAGATGGALALVTDRGVRHACATEQVPGMLGFPTGRTPMLIPAALLERVPEDVALDPVQARSAVPRRL